jgi:D-galactose 1-dehydrogenase
LARLRIGLVGAGKIAQDQHAPVIAASGDFELVGVVDPGAVINGVASFGSLADMRRSARPAAVAVCTPPQVRYGIAKAALEAGMHVLLEKPPCATVGELEDLARCARHAGATLFTAWHSQFAPAVPAARHWIAAHPPRRIQVDWREDVRRWHPGQDWIWRPGGLGVFDPGINALSILTAILREPLFVRTADLHVPSNREAPIAATVSLSTGGQVPIEAEFDWRHTGTQTWNIAVEAEDGGEMLLSMGGHRISTRGDAKENALEGEYPSIYRRFAALISKNQSEVHAEPLRLVADAFLVAERRPTARFDE